MDAGKSATTSCSAQGIHQRSAAQIGFLSLGIFLGVVSVSLWQQWCLVFGQDPEVLLATAFVIAISFWIGERWRANSATRGTRIDSLVLTLSIWSALHPFWIDTLASTVGNVPLSYLEQTWSRFLCGLGLAAAGLMIPSVLWSAIVAKSIEISRRGALPNSWTFAVLLIGISIGLILNSLVLAPFVGILIPTAVVAALACIVSWLFGKASEFGVDLASIPSIDAAFHRPAQESTISDAKKSGEFSLMQESRLIPLAMAFVVGVLTACHLRLMNQLMPHGAHVIFLQAVCVLVGIAAGSVLILLRRERQDQAMWGGLFAAAASSLLLANQPCFVGVSLWMNAKFSLVATLIAARSTLMLIALSPFGIAFAWIALSGKNPSPRRSLHFAVPFVGGMACATYLLGGIVTLIPLMAVGICALATSACILRLRSWGDRMSIPSASALACLSAAILSFPIWINNDDASRTAKTLYSTPAFIAYRSGWSIGELPYIDDIRLIERREGRTGPLTLWRGRVAELFIREAGIPRAILTKTSDALPQFAPEVMQAVYSMVFSERPDRVLFLGLSAGVPLATSLNFPIREAVCVEGDANLIDLVRGTVARETGQDPLADDRVTLRRISPELAVMAKPGEPYDVILSSALTSSMMDGAPCYTGEFYQRVSSQLSVRGLFCQRFECIDYGPEPLRLVLKSMQSAFRKVVAIETSAGEFLLFAANSDDVFVPSDLANRLEATHVRKILARCGLDWSALLNKPAYDDLVLKEIADGSHAPPNSCFNGLLAACTPIEVMRWSNKNAEMQQVLSALRQSTAPYWNDEDGKPKRLDGNTHLQRRSRIVEWLGDENISQALLRRLGEVDSQMKLVQEYPDAHWWAYRRTLRKQLQENPRSVIQQVKAIEEKDKLHPEDEHRRDYFATLGNAARRPQPTRQQIAAVEAYLEPHDPLISYFARQEAADLLARCGEDAEREMTYRLHVIYYAPSHDASVRNVAEAIERLVKHPETIQDDSARYDALNGLVQTLRVRWELRQSVDGSTSRKTLDNVEQSLLAAEKGVAALEELAPKAGVSPNDWQARKQVLDRIMLRPLRTYRTELAKRVAHSRQLSEVEDDDKDEDLPKQL